MVCLPLFSTQKTEALADYDAHGKLDFRLGPVAIVICEACICIIK